MNTITFQQAAVASKGASDNKAVKDSSQLAVVPKKTLKSKVIQDLGYRIVSGQMQTGEILQIEDVAREFSVSTTVTREAISVLVSLGLLESRKRFGTVVQKDTNWDHSSPFIITWKLQDPRQRSNQFRWLIEMRSALEPVAAELFAQRCDTALAAKLRRLLEQLEESANQGNLDTFLTMDIAFHELVFAQCGNPLISGLARLMDVVLTARHHYHLMPQYPDSDAIRYHRELTEAITCNDAKTARHFSSLIVTQAAEEFLSVVDIVS